MDEKKRIHIHQVRDIYNHAISPIISSFVASLFLAIILWDIIPHAIIIWALGVIMAIALARFAMTIMFIRRNPPDRKIPAWGAYYVVGLFLQGAAWGLGGIAMAPAGSLTHELIIMIWVIGLTAGAVGQYSILSIAVLMFVIPALTPWIVYFFYIGGKLHNYLGLSLLTYTVVLLSSMLRIHTSIIASLKLNIALSEEVKKRKLAEIKLRDAYRHTEIARNEVEEIIDHLQDVFFRLDTDGELLGTSPSVEDVFGYTLREMISIPEAQILQDEGERARFLKALETSGGVVRSYEVVAERKDGKKIWVSINAHYYYNQADEVAGVEGTARDITKRKLMEESLQKAHDETKLANIKLEMAKKEVEEMIDNLQDVFFRTNIRGEIIKTSPSVEDVFGYTQEEMEGRSQASLFAHEADLELFTDQLRESGGVVRSFEAKILHKTGREVWTSTNAHFHHDDLDQVEGIEGTIRDITERKRMEEALREISQRDGLTGLYNRRYFDEALDTEWKRASRGARPIPLALILIDIDFFKPFNDTYGHQEGDACLMKVGAALRDSVHRPGDVVARYGGEELAIILPNTELENALEVAERARLAVLELAIPHSGSRVNDYVTISSGVASTLPVKSDPASILVKMADQALYRAKETGRNQVTAWDEG